MTAGGAVGTGPAAAGAGAGAGAGAALPATGAVARLRTAREAVADLFARTTDPVEIIKWKDIHGLIEVAIDRCEDVANIVEMIVVKHR